MNHKEIKEKLSSFRDPELPADERQVIVSHLETCGECRRALENWDRIQNAFSQVAQPKPSEVFVSGVMDRLEAVEELGVEPVEHLRNLYRWLFPTLGYAFAVILMVMVLLPQQPIVDTEAVLLADVPQRVQWAFSQEPLDIGQLLNMKEDLQR